MRRSQINGRISIATLMLLSIFVSLSACSGGPGGAPFSAAGSSTQRLSDGAVIRGSQLTGSGLISAPLAGRTISSPSDIGFAVTSSGGSFVCSMSGPVTGNFMGLTVMDVEGPVTPGSFSLKGDTATFTGTATITLVPGMHGESFQVLNGIAYKVTATLGGPGKGSMILDIPAFTATLGGDTGGVLKLGRIGLGV
jgi:hypothetical protein